MWDCFRIITVIFLCTLSLIQRVELIACRSTRLETIVSDIYDNPFWLNNIRFCGNSDSKIIIYQNCKAELQNSPPGNT